MKTPKNLMSKDELLQAIEAQQMIQSRNHPTSAKWKEASDNLHSLVKLLTGRELKDAWGK